MSGKYDINASHKENLYNISGSNVELLTTLMLVCNAYTKYDKKSAYECDTPLMWCSEFLPDGIIFHEIFTHVCKENIERMIVLMRGVQKGYVAISYILLKVRLKQYDIYDDENWGAMKKHLCRVIPGFCHEYLQYRLYAKPKSGTAFVLEYETDQFDDDKMKSEVEYCEKHKLQYYIIDSDKPDGNNVLIGIKRA